MCVPIAPKAVGVDRCARHDVAMTKTKATLVTMALLFTTPVIAQASPLNAASIAPASPLNGQKCNNPGAIQRANNSRFVCSPEGARNVWRRVNGATTIGAIVNAMPNYSLLATALKAAGLDTTLVTSGPFTLFAPRDAAFRALPKETLDYLLAPANVAVLRKVLLNHVLGSAVRSTMLSSGTYTTLNGTTISVTVRKSGIMVDGAKVTVGDVIATNGVIHGVSKVLVPSDVVIKP